MQISKLLAFVFLLAPLAGLLGKRSSRWVTLVPALAFAGFASHWSALRAGPVLEQASWIPSLGIDLAFRLDGLSMLFALLITGIGSAIFLYASAYLRGEPRLGRFFVTLSLFMAAMLGAVLADNLLLLIVFWELTSLTSFLLIGFYPESEASRVSARQGLLVTVGGGLGLLTGAILLGDIFGSFSLSAWQSADLSAALADPRMPWALVCIALGAFTKSAQFPFHFWLPNAMVAPTPVSAYLHSATMVKLGVYLLARLRPTLSAHPYWEPGLSVVGGITMLLGAIFVLRQTDLKRVLAYSTLASLGTLIMLLGVPGQLGALAMVTFLLVHALYKACLFMVVGIIDHETGTRDFTTLSGLRSAMPRTAALALLGGLSMAGLPPLLGFAGKELMYEAGFMPHTSWLTLLSMVVTNAVMVVVAGLVSVRCFFGAARASSEEAHDPELAMWFGPLVLGLGGLGLGFALPWLGQHLLNLAAQAVDGAPVAYEFALFHGFSPMLGLSVVTLALGAALFFGFSRAFSWARALERLDRFGPERAFDASLVWLERIAKATTHVLQQGSLRVYLGRTLGVVALATLAALFAFEAFEMPADGAPITALSLACACLTAGASLSVLFARSWTNAIVSAGLVGFSVALLFLFHGAPDLAFTQFSVETLAVVILLAVVGRMPFRKREQRTRSQSAVDAVIALGFGAMLTSMLLSVLAQPQDSGLTQFFREMSLPASHGRNIVNVIIVDFRGFDTLGEITVLTLAALSALCVVSVARRKGTET